MNESSSNRRRVHQRFQLLSLSVKERTLRSSSRRIQTRVLVSDNQIARLEPDDIKTESTDSQSESSRDDIDVASPNSTEETSVVEGEQPSVATRTSSRNKKQPERFGETIPTNLLKKEGGCDISRSSELSNLS